MACEVDRLRTLRTELLSLTRSLCEEKLQELLRCAVQLAAEPAPVRFRPERRACLSLSYPAEPFVGLHEDICLQPEVRGDVSSVELQGFHFRIRPDPPATLLFDSLTGCLSGCVMQRYDSPLQFTVDALLKADGPNGESLGSCVLCLAVVAKDVADVCNRAFKDGELPANLAASQRSGSKSSAAAWAVADPNESAERAGAPSLEGAGRESTTEAVPARPRSAAVARCEQLSSAGRSRTPGSRPLSARGAVRPLGGPLGSRLSDRPSPWWYGAGSYWEHEKLDPPDRPARPRSAMCGPPRRLNPTPFRPSTACR